MSSDKRYLRSIVTLLSGSVVAQIFTLICTPILTRICSPEELGTYTLVTGAVTMFGMVMSLRYEICVVSEPDQRKAFRLIALSFRICCGVSVFVFFAYLIYFSTRDFENHSVILALLTGGLVFLLGIINILTAYNNRMQDYKLITRTYILRIFCQNAGNLIAGFAGFGAVGLSLSQLIGYCAGVRGQAKPLKQFKREILETTREERRAIAEEYKKQPLMSAPATFANGLSYSLINYFIEALFTTTLVGYYSISYRILGLPLSLVSVNVSRVFMEKASGDYQARGNFREIYRSTVGLLLGLAIPCTILLMLFAPWACEFVFGKGWHVAGEYIRILAPMFALRFTAGGVNCSAIIVNKQQYDLIIQILLTASVIVIFILSRILSLPISGFLTILSAVFSVIYAVYIYLFWLCAKGKRSADEI